LRVIPLERHDDGSEDGCCLCSSLGFGAERNLPFERQMPQSSLGLVVVDGDVWVFEESEIFFSVSSERDFDFCQRSRVKEMAFGDFFKNLFKFSLQIRRQLVADLFPNILIQI